MNIKSGTRIFHVSSIGKDYVVRKKSFPLRDKILNTEVLLKLGHLYVKDVHQVQSSNILQAIKYELNPK